MRDSPELRDILQELVNCALTSKKYKLEIDSTMIIFWFHGHIPLQNVYIDRGHDIKGQRKALQKIKDKIKELE